MAVVNVTTPPVAFVFTKKACPGAINAVIAGSAMVAKLKTVQLFKTVAKSELN
tara:strand:- start:11 stop:169 length:159 start_codon:yes stop_codon:yes gene_type:complete